MLVCLRSGRRRRRSLDRREGKTDGVSIRWGLLGLGVGVTFAGMRRARSYTFELSISGMIME